MTRWDTKIIGISLGGIYINEDPNNRTKFFLKDLAQKFLGLRSLFRFINDIWLYEWW